MSAGTTRHRRRLQIHDIKRSRKKSTERIDGIVAAIMALGRLMARPKKQIIRLDDDGGPMVLTW